MSSKNKTEDEGCKIIAFISVKFIEWNVCRTTSKTYITMDERYIPIQKHINNTKDMGKHQTDFSRW